jgi:hypothetical protein
VFFGEGPQVRGEFPQDASTIPQFIFFCFVRVAHFGFLDKFPRLGPPSIQDLKIRLALSTQLSTTTSPTVLSPWKKILSIKPGPSLGTKQKDWILGGFICAERVEF